MMCTTCFAPKPRCGEIESTIAVERSDEALARVHTAARQQPVLATPALLVAAQQDAVLPSQHGRDTNARFLHQW
jgi:hypothetical protein